MNMHSAENIEMLKAQRSSRFAQDLSRYRRNGKLAWYEPSLWALAVYRLGQFSNRMKIPLLRKILRMLHLPIFAFVTLLTGIHLPRGAQIGGGLRIWHFGGIFLNPDTVIGENCTIRQGVTIGNRQEEHDVPIIGDNVDIGAGARILGAIHIGNNVSIGANAVVLCDVPDNSIAVGVPARVLLNADKDKGRLQ